MSTRPTVVPVIHKGGQAHWRYCPWCSDDIEGSTHHYGFDVLIGPGWREVTYAPCCQAFLSELIEQGAVAVFGQTMAAILEEIGAGDDDLPDLPFTDEGAP